MKIDQKNINLKKGGFVVPIAIGVLVIASLGLLTFSWWNSSRKEKDVNQNQNTTTASTTQSMSNANDDKTLDSDSASIDANLKALDSDNADVDSGLSDKSDSLQ